MNETVSKFLLAGDTFMHEIHLTGPRFTSNLVKHYQKTKKEIKKRRFKIYLSKQTR